MAIVELTSVIKKYGDVLAVENFNLTTNEGEFVVLVGPSGCGKTTTMRMIAGLETVTGGEIKIAGKNVVGMIPRERDVAMVFQNYALFPHMNVFGNMSFGLRLRKFPREKIESRVHQAASILGIEHLLNRKPKELSGGERQRVALGRAIVREPQVFLMDEPLSNIDAKLRVEMRAEIIKLQRRLGVTTFYVTHDQVEALSMGDRIVVMSKGRVQQVGTPKELYQNPDNRFVAGFIGSPSMNFIRAQVTDKGTLSAGENFNVALPTPLSDAVRSRGLSEVILGVRPEHLQLVGNGQAENRILGVVDVVEPQGSTTILQVNVGADSKIIAQVNEQWGRQPGERLQFSIPPDAIHLFDPSTDQRVAAATKVNSNQ
ncbi:MAG TPA: ABC transporter ATP-binding protein [Chthoniobacterales bacterium]|nr:ABC transporter ATP-binding protein [Chthoniobacterales bacterium]